MILEEKCLACSKNISATIEATPDSSRSGGDLEEEHSVDIQSYGDDRILKGITAQGTCRSCSVPFVFKVFAVMQMRLNAPAAQAKR